MNNCISLILMMALSLSCLYSCEKPDENDIEGPEAEKDIHPYELNISAEGLANVNFLSLCVNMTSSVIYEFTIDGVCDWLEISNMKQVSGEVVPCITVSPNDTGKSRSVEVVIQSLSYSSHIYYDKHLIVQEAK